MVMTGRQVSFMVAESLRTAFFLVPTELLMKPKQFWVLFVPKPVMVLKWKQC
jgi:hypothetical protein